MMNGKGPADRVAIIVPFTDWNEWVYDCIAHCGQIDHPGFELWLLPNDPPPPEWEARLQALAFRDRIRIEPTGPANPGTKRNVAMRKSGARIFALVDSDAYPRADWLSKALPLLKDDVAIIAGPNLTHPQDELRRRAAGHVMASPLGFGFAHIRHHPVPRQVVNEMPTCNMVMRQPDGLLFREALDTAEDMVFCEETRARGLKVLYDPEVIVYHHRRQVFLPFFKQFYHYGLYKGKITRLGRHVAYAWQSFPTLLVFYALLYALAWFLPLPRWLFLAGSVPPAAYLLAIGYESFKASSHAGERLLTVLAFVTGHVGYGLGYLKGLVWPLADEKDLRP